MSENLSSPSDLRQSELNNELMINTLAGEVTRVMLAAPTLENSIRSYFLGLTEITGITRMGLFRIEPSTFSLKLNHCEGISFDELNAIKLRLDFLSGEYPDAIFLNKHVIVDSVDELDPFFSIGCKRYVAMPIISRITTKCWEVRNCGKTECPCYQGHNPYCWSVKGAALDVQSETEDEKREACIKCPQFKCEALLWLDMTHLAKEISGTAIAHVTGLNRSLGMVIESFNMYKKLKEANLELEEKNEILSCLNEELHVAHEKIDRELDHAKSIQKSLLPSSFPTDYTKGIASRYIPAGKVGGDYYDCFSIDEERIGIVIADVSGHGIAAALIMSMFKILLKSYSPSLKSPIKVLELINTSFLSELPSSHYVTVFYAIFNKNTRELIYANAGHTPQILLRNEEVIKLKASGLFVGILEEIMLKEERLILTQPSRLILYTDGITEAKAENDEMYGFEKFLSVATTTQNNSCIEALDTLMENFNEFKGEAEIQDDITIMFLDL